MTPIAGNGKIANQFLTSPVNINSVPLLSWRFLLKQSPLQILKCWALLMS